MNDLWTDFKAFAIKGNFVDLAVALILALAFTAIINSFLDDIIWPIIGGIVSDKSFAFLTFSFLGAQVRYGNFMTQIVYFLMVAVILFIVVMGYNRLRSTDVTTKSCPYCKSSIALAATRCPNCTSQLVEA
jgi:large conductance mechanosensitive channel